jgi:hypothetical protein
VLIRSLIAAAVVFAPAKALACATCGCGDPTLVVMGAEQPFAGRLRFGLQATGWSLSAGVPAVDEWRVAELRAEASVAYAPLPWLFISAAVPFQLRELSDISLAREGGFGPGDLDLRLRAYVFRDREMSANHLVAVTAGAIIPTRPDLRDGAGVPLSLDAQLSAGALTPLAGVAYSGFFGRLSAFASLSGFLPLRGYQGFRPGAGVRTTVAGQYQLLSWLGLRLGVEARYEGFAEEADGGRDYLASGFLSYAAPDVIFSPVQDLVVQLGVRIPALVVTPLPFRPGPMVTLAMAWDR